MKSKKILLFSLSIFMLLFLTGCGNKKAITKEDFIAKAEKHNYQIVDATSQFEQYDEIESATLALSPDNWQVEFYELNTSENAMAMFEHNKSKFEDYKDNTALEASKSMSNYATYSLTSGGYYMYLSTVDNTLIYLRVKDTYKDTVKDFIKELAY